MILSIECPYKDNFNRNYSSIQFLRQNKRTIKCKNTEEGLQT